MDDEHRKVRGDWKEQVRRCETSERRLETDL
jgi:hypothetical protein